MKTDSISDSADLFKILSADTTYKEQGWTPYSSGWEVYVDNARADFLLHQLPSHTFSCPFSKDSNGSGPVWTIKHEDGISDVLTEYLQ